MNGEEGWGIKGPGSRSVSLSEIMKVKFAEARRGMVNQKEKRFGIK